MIKIMKKFIYLIRYGLISSALVFSLMLIMYLPHLLSSSFLSTSVTLDFSKKSENILFGAIYVIGLSWLSWGLITSIILTPLLAIAHKFIVFKEKDTKDLLKIFVKNLLLTIPAVLVFSIFALILYFVIFCLLMLISILLGQ